MGQGSVRLPLLTRSGRVRNPSSHGEPGGHRGKFSADLRPLAWERRRARNFSGHYFFDPRPAPEETPRPLGGSGLRVGRGRKIAAYDFRIPSPQPKERYG